MGKYNHKPVLLLVILIFICATARSQAEFVSEKNGTITVRTEGTAKKIDAAIADAEKYVFYMIFYKGIPGSTFKNPLIETGEDETERINKDYFDAFYNSRYQNFVTSVVQNSCVMKEKHHKKSVFLDVTVNANALRKDLEDNQIIRKFGF